MRAAYRQAHLDKLSCLYVHHHHMRGGGAALPASGPRVHRPRLSEPRVGRPLHLAPHPRARSRLAPDAEPVRAGDVAVVPAGAPIQVSNAGDGEAEVVVAIAAGFSATAAD